ncbi:MAG: uracil-DNA glycosylase family protein [bacterium]
MNKSELAYQLHRYINAARHEEPPDQPSFGESMPEESQTDEGTSSTDPEETVTEDDQPSPEERLGDLEDEAEGCPKCRLSENRTQVVFGEGTVEARIMVIGEGPGADEDREGYPFVGRWF